MEIETGQLRVTVSSAKLHANPFSVSPVANCECIHGQGDVNPYPTAFPYGNGMVLHFYQQQESSTIKTVHKVINKGRKTYV